MTNQGRVLSRESILDRVWGFDYYGDIRAVDTHVKKLRHKLTGKSTLIQTVVRSGYKFEVRI
jgi:DNA-binding response OmpR family regulator